MSLGDRPWIKSYPPGVKWDADISPTPVQQILEDAAANWPGNPAIDFMGRKITFTELNDLANRAAAGLQKLGVGPGIHVGLYLANTPHYLISLFGVLKAGGTVDKMVGDALHAMFNAPLDQPDHSARAVDCALAIHRFATGFAMLCRAQGIPFGETRIGVTSGGAVVGIEDAHLLDRASADLVAHLARAVRQAAVVVVAASRVPLGLFRDGWFRLVIRDGHGRYAWSNPMWRGPEGVRPVANSF